MLFRLTSKFDSQGITLTDAEINNTPVCQAGGIHYLSEGAG